MARQLRELRVRILAAVGAGFALAAATGACAGESSESEAGGGTSAGGKGGTSSVGGASMTDSGGVGSGGGDGTAGMGGGVIVVDGRPFVVAGELRLPDVKVRKLAFADDALASEDRRALAARWIECARREHASVAAFAVLALELLAVGAPAELVKQANQAALDEIEHARLAFAVASRFAGYEVTPGALDLTGIAPSTDLADIAARAACEGCVLETIGVALSLARLDGATDPEIERVLERIVSDETRHAEFSYRLVAWAIGSGGPRVRQAVARGLALPPDIRVEDEPGSTACARYGMLERGAAFEVVAEARHRVIEPAASALLSLA